MNEFNAFNRDLGKLEGRVEAVEKRQEEHSQRIDERLSTIETDIKELVEVSQKAKFGYQIIVGIPAFTAFLVTVSMFVIDYIK